MTKTNRRNALKALSGAAAVAGIASESQRRSAHAAAPQPPATWSRSHDRVWLGGEFWANPMEDWQIRGGAAECTSAGGGRSVHWITKQIGNPSAGFEMSVSISLLESGLINGGAGFQIGLRSELNEYRSNTFAGGGLNAGWQEGELVLGKKRQRSQLNPAETPVALRLRAVPAAQGPIQLELTASAAGEPPETLTLQVAPASLLGNLAIANNFDSQAKGNQGARYRFADWTAFGDAIEEHPERTFGPLLWSMYSLSDSRSAEGFVLKVTALTGPLGEADSDQVELQVQRDQQWHSLGTASLDEFAWTATFRIPNWDQTQTVPYRVVYREQHLDGNESESIWTGTIRANPAGRPLRMAALTCQNQLGFPYEPVANNIARLDPDLVYFSGDQLYEAHGGFGIIREPADLAILNYLRKFYMFGWAFRESIRHAPTLCIPDDHDVFQGNIWGEGGAPMQGIENGASSKGGYREPAKMVNVVHKTNCSHHPDYYDPTPVKQGISVYYGDMVYGDVSFAILGDRQFKSGPERVETGSGRADHVKDQHVDTKHLDAPGLVLLGERQEAFLKHWVKDWRGHRMKVLLSQTVFAGVATHHGSYDGYLKADLDSGGWPQTPRDRAIRILREGMPLHINGDQHLTSLVQYGVDQQRDACWSFCTPAIAVGYPRWWRPDEVSMEHANRPAHDLPDTGEYRDGFGNRIYVYAIGNPIVPTAKNRYEKAHQKGSGLGFVTIDTDARTYRIEAFRFLVDATDGQPSNQFPGWPVTIHQVENRGGNRLS